MKKFWLFAVLFFVLCSIAGYGFILEGYGEELGGTCVDHNDCIPCALCVDRGGPDNICVWACSEGYGCGLGVGGYLHGKCQAGLQFLPTDCTGTSGTGGSSSTVDFIGPSGSTVATWDDASGTLNVWQCPADGSLSLPGYAPCDPGTLITDHRNPFYIWSVDNDGWYRAHEYTSEGGNCWVALSHYVNLDETELYCLAHDYEWLSPDTADMDNCPYDVPGVCSGATADTCETGWNQVCVSPDDCQEWCHQDGTCWGEEEYEDDEADNWDYFCDDLWWEEVADLPEPPATLKCCGDDLGDCGYIDSEWLCYDDSGGDWHWGESTSGSGGFVIKPSCGNSAFVSEFVSAAHTWLECDGNAFIAVSQPYPISRDPVTGFPPHDYLCNESEIYECTGSDTCDYDCSLSPLCISGSDGNCLGQDAVITVEMNSDNSYFCNSSGAWVELTAGAYDANEEVCEGSGYTWLVDKCCGDALDDTYTASDFRACWDGNVTQNGELAVVDVTVLNLNGKFLTCGYTGDDSDPVFVNAVACNVSGLELLDEFYYCNISLVTGDGVGWVSLTTDPPGLTPDLTPPATIDELSPKGSPTATTQGCCPLDYCWIGDSCIANTDTGRAYDEFGVSYGPDSDTLPGDLYQCIAGSWTLALPKFDQNYEDIGFCDDNQCYHSSDNCYEIGEYVGDDYCEIADSGEKSWEWTTRTKFVALDLLKFVHDGSDFTTDYTLACGDFDKVLNKPSDVLNLPGVAGFQDKFCVLEYYEPPDTKIRIIGVALEKGTINVPTSSFLLTLSGLSIDYCDDAMADVYLKCGAGNSDQTMWFNNDTETLLFSDTSISPVSEPSGFLDAIYGFLYGLVDWVSGISLPSGWSNWDNHYVIPDIDKTRRFDRLYMSKKGDKKIFAILELPVGPPGSLNPLPYTTGTPPTYVDSTRYYEAIKYEGFNIDMCYFVEEYDDKSCPRNLPESVECFYCERDGTTYKVFANYEVTGSFGGMVPAWIDLTSKLRIE